MAVNSLLAKITLLKKPANWRGVGGGDRQRNRQVNTQGFVETTMYYPLVSPLLSSEKSARP